MSENKKSRFLFWNKEEKQTVKQKAPRTRRFEAAKNYNTLQNWVTSSIQKFDEEIKTDLPSLRARSRDASINDVYARRYFKVLKVNVVGSGGINLKMGIRNSGGTPDTLANTIIEERWSKFSKNITVDGMNLRETLCLFLETCARDGEVFLVIKRGDDFGPHKIQLQFLESEFLDEQFNGVLSNGNTIVNGIEYDQLQRRIAYHFWKSFPHGTNRPNNVRVRVDAKDVIHGYDRERAAQGRGYPWLSSALIALVHIKEYRKSELVASRVASAKMGVFTRPENENSLGDLNDDVDENAIIQEAVPGSFDVLPRGYKLETYDPQNPNGNFGDFVKHILRGVAASVGLAYHTIANDLESTSYSSLRQGAIDERDTYRDLQQFLIDTILTPLFEEWLANMLAFRIDNVRLPLDGFDKFNQPVWRPRIWQWIDPAKETLAIKLQSELKLRSRTDMARGLGLDIKDVFDEIAAETAYAESVGIDLNNESTIRAIDDKLIDEIMKDEEKPPVKPTKNE